jgi:hypothetical protein
MDIIKLYYTNMPFVSINLLLCVITNLSNYINSSQNVKKFIYEHKDCDSIIFTKELNNLDLINKLKLIEMIFIDIIKKHSNNEEEYIQIIKYIKHPHEIHVVEEDYETNFTFIQIDNFNFEKYELFNKISDPIKFSIISIYEIINKLNNIIESTNNKINNYNKSYLKITLLSLKNEIEELKYYSNKLEKRFNNFIELLKI